ncbi:MAG: phosphatase PAP2 family protein [Clostridia bacterium]|nr:phosphatase PAP2 family protein [Clostridia bacterium]
MTGAAFSFPWEVDLMAWLQAQLGESWIRVVSFFSAFGEEMFLIVVMGLMYWGLNKAFGKRIGLTLLMGIVWNPMIKNIFLRRRPYFDHENIRLYRLVDPNADQYDIAAQGFSFPSGHSTNAAGLCASFASWWNQKWLKALCILMPILVGISRVIVGAHFPTDVIVGWILGICCFLIVSFLESKIKSTPKRYLTLLITALPGLFYCRSTDYFTAFGMLVGFMAGVLFEEKKVHFQNTRNVLFIILRIAFGGALYLGLNWLLKKPFSPEFLVEATLPSLLVRSARYVIICFIAFGVYPMAFQWVDNWLAKRKK